MDRYNFHRLYVFYKWSEFIVQTNDSSELSKFDETVIFTSKFYASVEFRYGTDVIIMAVLYLEDTYGWISHKPQYNQSMEKENVLTLSIYISIINIMKYHFVINERSVVLKSLR